MVRERSPHHARRQVLRLTAAGRREHARLDRGAAEQWSQLLAGVPEVEQRRLLGAMDAVSPCR
ncbi:MAG TPA: MarR family winged helix-turn-helix transcriptional regulator [Baekduia sp.]|nr:MarR family winged helix-turn-helix transcriptional regulator [Baekduia sp.]